MVIVKRALLSCSDKTGVEALAKGLHELKVELIASSGTAALLRRQKIPVKAIEEFTGVGEQLDGRVKTLHPKIHAGILAKRDDPAHMTSVTPAGLIDLVVVNLYPFHEVSQQTGVARDAALEQIDIGGVALLRAAAKNFPHVAAVSRPEQYAGILAALRIGRGTLPEDASAALARDAFELTSRYDQWIASFLGGNPDTGALSAGIQLSVHQRQALRYGENPHQQGGWYAPDGEPAAGLARLAQVQGKELSYNNVLDLDAAVRCLSDLDEPACVIVKHASPCGVATASTIAEAYQRAHACDPESAFGGIVGVNRPLDALAASLMAPTFLEVILAPKIDPPARAILLAKRSLRLIECPLEAARALEWRSIVGGWLIQGADAVTLSPDQARVVTTRRPTEAEWRDLTLGWIAAKHVKSNAIVVAKGGATVGIGPGQPSRVRAVRLALQNAGPRARGAVLASDGFFPFPDNVDVAAEAGITAIIQPGGSVKDPEVIAAADRVGLAMVLTGLRHFRH